MPKLLNPKPKLSTKLPALAKSVKVATAHRVSLWMGPCDEGPMGGCTQSMLGSFLCCREKFRLRVVEGLKPHDTFSHRMEYGNMWHVCEEHFAKSGNDTWESYLKSYCRQLVAKYREQGKEIEKWYNVCKTQFPIYIDYWAKHPDVKSRQPVFQEEVFNVPYRLPSGRVVRLRGKWDAVDLIGKGLYLQENKSKGEIDVEKIKRDLAWDLQTMMYLTALQAARKYKLKEKTGKYHIETINGVEFKPGLAAPVGFDTGVRYNVIRRPLGSRGKHNIRQREGRQTKKGLVGAETDTDFYKRLGEVIETNPKDFFVRFKMEVSQEELKRFQDQCLNPILSSLCSWWDSIKQNPFDPWELHNAQFSGTPNPHHWIYPHGVYNPALEGRVGDYDQFIQSGSTAGLSRVSNLFTELQ